MCTVSVYFHSFLRIEFRRKSDTVYGHVVRYVQRFIRSRQSRKPVCAFLLVTQVISPTVSEILRQKFGNCRFSTVFTERCYTQRGLCCRKMSVRLSVCPSHAGILSKRRSTIHIIILFNRQLATLL